jgi:hypothetical protein
MLQLPLCTASLLFFLKEGSPSLLGVNPRFRCGQQPLMKTGGRKTDLAG